MGKSVLFYNILSSFEISLLYQHTESYLTGCTVSCWGTFKVWYLPWLIRRKATDITLASSKGSDQSNFTVLTGQKTGWISGGFKLKPVTGVLAPSGIGTIRSQSENFPKFYWFLSVWPWRHILPPFLCILWPDGISPTLNFVKKHFKDMRCVLKLKIVMKPFFSFVFPNCCFLPMITHPIPYLSLHCCTVVASLCIGTYIPVFWRTVIWKNKWTCDSFRCISGINVIE